MDTVNYRHSLKKTHKKTFGVRGTYSDGAQLAAWAPPSSCNLHFFCRVTDPSGVDPNRTIEKKPVNYLR